MPDGKILFSRRDARPTAKRLALTEAEKAAIEAEGTATAEEIAKETLDTVKRLAIEAIDQAAGEARARHLTVATGQDLVYQAKAAEAERLKVTSSLDRDPDPADYPFPDLADYPFLVAEVGITANSIAEVAATILATRRDWTALGAAIETTRLGAKRDVEAAETPEAVLAAIENLAWPQGPHVSEEEQS